MASDPDNSTSHNVQAGRRITIYQIIGFVLPWNTAYKASRVLNTLFALELGATPLQTGLLLATYGLFPMLFAVTAGKVIPELLEKVLPACEVGPSTTCTRLPVLPVKPLTGL